MDGSSKARVWISASAHNGRDGRALGPRATVPIDQLRSQESFPAYISLSLAGECATYMWLYKIYALKYVSILTHMTAVSFQCSLLEQLIYSYVRMQHKFRAPAPHTSTATRIKEHEYAQFKAQMSIAARMMV